MRQLWQISGIAAAILMFGSASKVSGQVAPAPTTVQLPSFSFFTVQTTVSVPDRGGMELGGIRRGADGRTTFGNGSAAHRGLASSRGASGVSATAAIVNHQELDRAVLAAAAGERPASTARAASEIAVHLRQQASSSAPNSVSAIRQQQAAAAEQRNAELAAVLLKANQAEAAGKTELARLHYQTVARQASGELQRQAEVRLAALASPRAATARHR
jgi:hypothetical protein